MTVGARGVYSFDAAGLAITSGVEYAVALALVGSANSAGLIYIYRFDAQPGEGLFGFGQFPPVGHVGIDLAVRIVMNHETSTTPVPEPSTCALFGLSAGGVAVLARRRRSGAVAAGS